MTASKDILADRYSAKSSIHENAIIKKISLVSIIGNIILSGFKLFAGICGRSGAMISDSIHSMSDVITTFIAFLGVKISKNLRIKSILMDMTGWSALPRCFWDPFF